MTGSDAWNDLPARRRAAFVGLAAAFWAACTLFNLPLTYYDDSVIVGPAVSLWHDGTLNNIYLSRRFYAGSTYLFYPPVFFWILAGWMTLFGKTVAALSAFWAICCAAAGHALGLLLVRLTQRGVGYLAAPALLFGCVAYSGYRYEMLAFATLFAGIALGLGGRRGIGYFLLCLTPTIAPTAVGSCMVAIGALLVYRRHPLKGELVRLGLALVAAVLVLTLSVSGALGTLIVTVWQYRGVRMGAGGQAMLNFRLVFGFLALNVVSAACAALAFRRKRVAARVYLPLMVAAAQVLTQVLHARPSSTAALDIATLTLLVLTFGDIVAQRATAANARPVLDPARALGLVAVLLAALNAVYLRVYATGPLAPGQRAFAAAAVARVGPTQLVAVDPPVMKEALGFPVGRRIEDATIRQAFPRYWQNLDAIPANEVWIISRVMLTGRFAMTGPMTPARMPDYGRVTRLFIADGIPRVDRNGICVFDQATGRRWQSRNLTDLIKAACTPAD